jgi:hypothetical protein
MMTQAEGIHKKSFQVILQQQGIEKSCELICPSLAHAISFFYLLFLSHSFGLSCDVIYASSGNQNGKTFFFSLFRFVCVSLTQF